MTAIARSRRNPLPEDSGKRTVVLVVAGIVGLFVLISVVGTISSIFRKTPADKIALSYGGGPFEGAQYQRTVDPGSGLVLNGVFDKWYEYPTTQRNYIISGRSGEGDVEGEDFITAATDDKVQVRYEVAVYFKLNTSLVRQFHENIGLKYHAWTDAGWDRMLLDNFRQPIESALQTESRRHTVDALFSDEEAVKSVQDGIAANLKERVSRLLGDAYFCGPTHRLGASNCTDFQVILKKPSFPEQIVSGFEAQERSAADVVTAQNNARVKEEEARGVKLQQEALRENLTPQFIAYLEAQARLECAKNPNCTLIISDTGTDVNVNTGRSG